MNERIKELANQAGFNPYNYEGANAELFKKFADLIVRECINNLEFHGFDDAVPYIKWMATNNLGVKE